MNQNFEFPNILDLKPYSYHHVMKSEGLLDDGSKADKNVDAEQEANKEADEEEEEPQPEIIEDDCFEYKLVGVNVHSGTAHAGHYWSYINTKRGLEECEGNDPNWEQTESDPWMEYNDSTVKEFATKNIKSECYGDAPTSSSSNFNPGMMSGWGGSFGGSYGKSGYMLFYERRVKKPILLVSDKKEEEVKDDP
jgi:ubiquitin carboxyl-terminal hydrolase 34